MSFLQDDLNNILQRAETIQLKAHKRKIVAIAIPTIASVIYLGFTIFLINQTQNTLSKTQAELTTASNKLVATETELTETTTELAEKQAELSVIEAEIIAARNTLAEGNVAAAQEKLEEISTDDFRGNETRGFKAILSGNLNEARRSFGLAYEAYPTYHNVDEIYNRVLTSEQVNQYQQADSEEKAAILDDIKRKILTDYSWGMPEDLRLEMQAQIAEQ